MALLEPLGDAFVLFFWERLYLERRFKTFQSSTGNLNNIEFFDTSYVNEHFQELDAPLLEDVVRGEGKKTFFLPGD